MGGKHINWAELLPKLNGLVMGGMSYAMAAKIIGINASTYAKYRYLHKDKLAKPSADIDVYKARIAELEAQIAELKAQGEEKPKPPHPRPYPEYNQLYFYVNLLGVVEKTKWDSGRFDLMAHKIGNVFFGKTAAVFAAIRMRVLAEMREWAGKWNDIYAIAYVVSYDKSRIIVNERLNNLSYAEIRFATIEAAENCIKAVGEERLKKYYFMVPEEETNNG